MGTIRRSTVIAICGAAALGCSHRKTTAESPAPAPVARETADAGDRDDSAARRDSIAAAERARADAAKRAEAVRATLVAPIHFDYDQFNLTGDARGLLDQKLTILRASPSVHLRIGGHADERGSDEYNLALGQRRAASVRQYLVWSGIDEKRLEVASYGEERPVCMVSEESCWARNRRAEFEITQGANGLTMPPK
jgi:peptidoglycan-associated lipoprotein